MKGKLDLQPLMITFLKFRTLLQKFLDRQPSKEGVDAQGS